MGLLELELNTSMPDRIALRLQLVDPASRIRELSQQDNANKVRPSNSIILVSFYMSAPQLQI